MSFSVPLWLEAAAAQKSENKFQQQNMSKMP